MFIFAGAIPVLPPLSHLTYGWWQLFITKLHTSHQTSSHPSFPTIPYAILKTDKSRNHTLLDTLHQQCIENVVSKQNLRGPISTLTDSSSDCQDIQVVYFLSKQAELVGYLTMYKTFNYFSCFQAYRSLQITNCTVTVVPKMRPLIS